MPFKIALTIAGAVSLGSFEAGVMFEVLDAIAQHNSVSPTQSQIHIDVLTGASAGGMTAAIIAHNLLFTGNALSAPYKNPLYAAWVAGVDIHGLLPLANDESPEQSILSSNFVRTIAQNLLLSRYNLANVPPATSHPALDPTTKSLSIGLALSNLCGVDYAEPILSGGTFDYTQFQDQITFQRSIQTDAKADWQSIADSAVACGAFPFAFRPCGLPRDINDYSPINRVAWASSPRTFAYTDGGVFQNQPLGLAKNLVDEIDKHLNTENRSYLFVSPGALASTAQNSAANKMNFQMMLAALVNAIYNQAGFRDWIEAESVNAAISVFNKRAIQLLALFKATPEIAPTLQPAVEALLPQFQRTPNQLASDRLQLRMQYATEFAQLPIAAANTWLDSLLLLELAADLHTRDEMYIYSVSADRKDLAGAGLFSFFGFLYRDFREHDYDLGRQKAQALLTSLHAVSEGKLPTLIYTPNPFAR